MPESQFPNRTPSFESRSEEIRAARSCDLTPARSGRGRSIQAIPQSSPIANKGVMYAAARYSVCPLISLPLPTNPRNPHSKLSIQRLLLILRCLHTKCIFNLRRCPKTNRRPGHHADAEKGPCFRREGSVGTSKIKTGLDTGPSAQLESRYGDL